MTAKNASASVIILATVIMVIGSSVWGLLWYWNSQPEPTTYIVVSVERNIESNGVSNGNNVCDTPYVTVVRDSITHQISRKCGNLGQPSAVISLDE